MHLRHVVCKHLTPPWTLDPAPTTVAQIDDQQVPGVSAARLLRCEPSTGARRNLGTLSTWPLAAKEERRLVDNRLLPDKLLHSKPSNRQHCQDGIRTGGGPQPMEPAPSEQDSELDRGIRGL